MTLKLSIYLGLSPPCEMPQKVPVSLFLSEEEWMEPDSHAPFTFVFLLGQAQGWNTDRNEEGKEIILDHPTTFPNPLCRGESSPECCLRA